MSSPPPFHGQHLVVCNWRDSAHPQAGGAELYCEELATQLHRLGAHVTLVTSRPPGTAAEEETRFGRVVRRGGKFSTYPLVLLWLFLNRSRVDGVIDAENGIPYFSPLALARRTPVVLLIFHVHQQQFASYMPAPLALVGRVLEKWAARIVYARRPVCAISPSGRAEIRRQLALRGPLFVAPSGLTVGHTARSGPRSTHPHVVCVGRLVPHKRYDLLVDALPAIIERWPGLRVDVVGEGESRPALERRAAELGLQGSLRFHGRVTEAERDGLMARAWITVNPSVGEGWGLSVIEAAALGVPAVAFRVPGLRDSVRDGVTGWLIDDGDSLADAVDAALGAVSDTHDAAGWAARCRRWATGFTWEATAQRILAVLASEQERLGRRYDERRSLSDSMTVVDLPADAVEGRVLGRLRRLDQIRSKDDGVELLLSNADEHDALMALDRVGVPRRAVRGVRVARHADLLGWLPVRAVERGQAPSTAGLSPEAESRRLWASASEVQLERSDGSVLALPLWEDDGPAVEAGWGERGGARDG